MAKRFKSAAARGRAASFKSAARMREAVRTVARARAGEVREARASEWSDWAASPGGYAAWWASARPASPRAALPRGYSVRTLTGPARRQWARDAVARAAREAAESARDLTAAAGRKAARVRRLLGTSSGPSVCVAVAAGGVRRAVGWEGWRRAAADGLALRMGPGAGARFVAAVLSEVRPSVRPLRPMSAEAAEVIREAGGGRRVGYRPVSPICRPPVGLPVERMGPARGRAAWVWWVVEGNAPGRRVLPLSAAEVGAMRDRAAAEVLGRAARRAAARAAGVSGVVSSTSREEAAAAARVALLGHWDCIRAGCPVLGSRASRGVLWLSSAERVARARSLGGRARSCTLGIPLGGPEYRAAAAARASIRGEVGVGMSGDSAEVERLRREGFEAAVESLATPGPDPAGGDVWRRALILGRACQRAKSREVAAAAAEVERLRRSGAASPAVAAAARSLQAARERGTKLQSVVIGAALGRSLPELCGSVGWAWDWQKGEAAALRVAMGRSGFRGAVRAEVRLAARRVEGWDVGLGLGPGAAARLGRAPFGGPDGVIA